MAVTVAETIFASPVSYLAVGRQVAQGSPRLQNLYTYVSTDFDPNHAFNMSDRGIEVGSHSITNRPSQKESFVPEVTVPANLTVGSYQNFRLMVGYMDLAEGVAPGSPVTTTLNGAISSRHAKVATLASVSGLAAGDWLQIGALATPGAPLITDKSEVHELVSVGATSAVQNIYLWGSGGTFTASDGTTTSSGLANNVSSASLQTALQTIYGSGNVTVGSRTGSGTYADPYVYPCTFASGLASQFVAPIQVSGANLTPTSTTTVTGAGVYVKDVTVGCAAAQVAFKGRLLYTYATGVAVAKVDSAKAVTHYQLHVQPDNVVESDLYSIYYRIVNSQGVIVEGLMYDVAGANFSPNYQTGQIAKAQGDVKPIRVTRDPGICAGVFASLLADPSNRTVSNPTGSFSFLSNTYDAPISVGFTESATLYDDIVLTQLFKQSNVHLEFSFTAQLGSKFIKDFFDQIVYNGASNYTVSAAIAESNFNFISQSANAIYSTVYYEHSLYAPDVQALTNDMRISGANPVMGDVSVKVIANQTTGVERWYWKLVNTCTSDVYSSY
jgi:hypothetical protein